MQLAQAGSPGVLVITSSDADLYMRFTDALMAEHAALTDQPGVRINRIRLDENGQLSGPIPADTAMIVSVGAKTARTVAGLDLNTPVLYTLIPASTYKSLVPAAASCSRQSAIFIDQPIERQIWLAQTIFPQAESYGALLGPTSSRHRETLEAIASTADWRLVIKEITADTDPEWQTRELVDETDLIIAISDPHALNRNNAKWLLYSAYQRQNPVIGFSRAYVKAGAAAAVYSTPEQIGKQTAELLGRFEKNNRNCLSTSEFPEYYKVAVNADVIHSLGGASRDESVLLRSLMEHEKVRQ